MKRIKKIYTAIIALWPILNVYGTPIDGFGMGDLFVILLLPFVIISYFKNKKALDKTYKKLVVSIILFISFSIITSLLSIIIFNGAEIDIIKRLIVTIFYVILSIICIKQGIIDRKLFIKVYCYAAIIASFAILLQYFFHYVLHKNLYLLIGQLKLSPSNLQSFADYKNKYDLMYLYNFRPTSFFLEPAHFAAYASPSIYILLNKNKKIKNILFAIIVSLSVILSTSGIGIVATMIIWAYYLLKNNENQKLKVITILVFGIFIAVFVNNSIFDKSAERIRDINKDSESSINYRLLKGYKMYPKMQLYEQIFGIGLGGYESYVRALGDETELDSNEYMNSVSYILVSTGLIGFIIFCIYMSNIYKLFRSKNNTCIFIVLITIYLTSSAIFSCNDVLLIVLGTLPIIEKQNNEMQYRQNNL